MLRDALTFDNAFRAVVIALVGIVGIVALALSYDALYQMAEKHGHSGWKSYAWPALIDLPLVVFTLVMLYAQVRGMGRWTVAGLLCLVLAYTGATIYLNYLESDGSIEGVFVRVAAPVGLFVCTEVLRHLLKFEIDHKGKAMTLAEMTAHIDRAKTDLDRLNRETAQQRQEALAELKQLSQQRDTLTAHIDEQRSKLDDLLTGQTGNDKVSFPGNERSDVAEMNVVRQSKIDERRSQVFEMVNDGMAQAAIADELDVSPSTIRRDIKALKDDGYLVDDDDQKQGSFDGLIDALPMDTTGQDALKESVDYFTNGKGVNDE